MTFEEGNFYTLNGVVDIARCQSKRIKLLEQRSHRPTGSR
jgi:hypothetical protein